MPNLAGEHLRAHNRDQYLAVQFAPAGARENLAAVFCLDAELGRIRNLVTDPLIGEMRLTWWRDTLVRPDQITGNPITDTIARAISTHDLPPGPIEVMIEARRLELYHQPVATFDELTCYFADTLGTAFSLG
ncbi:MAG: squalene/phytoene synthase family protein, partial [Alphaproteobacteria bacterium]